MTRPGLERQPQPSTLAKFQVGDTGGGARTLDATATRPAPSRSRSARYTAREHEDGAEKLYVFHLNAPRSTSASRCSRRAAALIDPFILGAPDENTVQGYAGTPFDVNGFTFDYLAPVQAAAADFPRQKAYYVAVDSPRDTFTGELLTGKYLLNAWVNDVTPPQRPAC